MQPLSTLGMALMVAQADVTRCGFFRPEYVAFGAVASGRKAIVANCATRTPRVRFFLRWQIRSRISWVHPTAKLRCTY